MAMGNPFCKKDGAVNPAAIAIVVLLALAVAFGISCALSANRALEHAAEAREAYENVCKSLENAHFDEAYSSARSAVDSLGSLSKELEGPQWSVAAALPVIGDDVRIARELGTIAGRLAGEVASPVFNHWDSIAQALAQCADVGGGVKSSDLLMKKISEFPEVLAHAKQVVLECEEQANHLPAAHNGKLNDTVGELKKAITAVGDTLRAFDKMVEDFNPAKLLGGVLHGLDLGSLFAKK